ncbi:MAG: hypothetical protein ACUZ8H_16350 [Candidatus Anammoxibacter sp.]
MKHLTFTPLEISKLSHMTNERVQAYSNAIIKARKDNDSDGLFIYGAELLIYKAIHEKLGEASYPFGDSVGGSGDTDTMKFEPAALKTDKKVAGIPWALRMKRDSIYRDRHVSGIDERSPGDSKNKDV